MDLKEVLYKHYHIPAASINRIEGGWSASAYLLTDNKNQQYLLKVYDKSRASTLKLTSGIDDYMPVVKWLNQCTNLTGKIVNPLTTNRGSYKCEDEYGVYLVSEYIEGTNLINKSFTEKQILQLAGILSTLHCYGEDIPVPTQNIKENFQIDFHASLLKLMEADKELKKDLHQVVSPYVGVIKRSADHLIELSNRLRSIPLKHVLCHTDIHEGNLLQGKNELSLIDWEGMKLAPPEADLFSLVNRPWFDQFFNTYNPNYKINKEVLRFYQQRRVLEDIWEFMEQLQFDNLMGEERRVSLNYLEKECESLSLFSKEF